MSTAKPLPLGSPKNISNDDLNSLLDSYNEFLTHNKVQVDFSKQMLSHGAKTELAIGIENMVKNPLAEIFKMSCVADNLAETFIDRNVKNFLSSKSNIILSAFKNESKVERLHYCIVLKSDTTVNRKDIFDFLSYYESFDIAKKFPIYFQFISKRLKDSINKKEVIV